MEIVLFNQVKESGQTFDTTGLEDPKLWTWRKVDNVWRADHPIHIGNSFNDDECWFVELKQTTQFGEVELLEMEGTIKLSNMESREPSDIDWDWIPDSVGHCWEEIEELVEDWSRNKASKPLSSNKPKVVWVGEAEVFGDSLIALGETEEECANILWKFYDDTCHEMENYPYEDDDVTSLRRTWATKEEFMQEHNPRKMHIGKAYWYDNSED